MSEKKIITVFGATGSQGGGVARAILNDPSSDFAVRAVTRDPSSAKAQELAKLGAELVQADLDSPGTVQKALEGAYGAYFVTFFWAHYSPEKETAEARSFAEAAKAAGIQHAVWSTLEDVRNWYPLDDNRLPTLNGKYKVPHFDGKGEGDRFFTESGVPTTFYRAAFYWDNFIGFGSGPSRGEDGKLALTLPLADGRMGGIAAEDIGKCAYGVFKRPDLIGQTIGVAGEVLTGRQMADQMAEALGEPVDYRPFTFDQFRSLGFPGAEDLGNMFQFYVEQQDYLDDARSVSLSRELNPELQNFRQWLSKNAKSIPV